MINQLRSEEEDLKMHMEQYVEQEMVYGGDASTARFDYEDDYPEKASRIRVIEMEIEDALHKQEVSHKREILSLLNQFRHHPLSTNPQQKEKIEQKHF